MASGIYVKLYREAYNSGLLGALGAERWHTLCALAVHMNDRGECFPSQDSIAERLGIRRETVNRRIKALCDFRWNGSPILTKQQRKSERSGQFTHTVYQLTADCGFQFGKDEEVGESEPSDADVNYRVTLM